MTPQSRPLSVLLTRPQAQGDRFAAQLADRFGNRIAVTTSPVIAPAYLVPEIPALAFSALVFTSETAVTSARFPGLPRRAYCVGDRTAAAAAAAGFAAVSAKGDAAALIALIRGSGESGPLLHLRGADTRGDIAAILTAAGIPTRQAVTYDQRPQPLSPEAAALLNGETPVLLPLFSPRTAEILASLGPFRAPLLVAALSPAVASAAARLHPARLATADAPDADALLTAVSIFVNGPAA
ncbi:uroporphyrinogen-III synthase [Paragemmobacter straminiformis]|uniref:Uroporphyrinogen-III synthase n=1 Tax=Paragemmobacter straminiformis TaxID=2045119 RepID=A0A842I8R5_9RHOB|nr:uroporphyrinogen-III synthase [Gemmobacter straminiformis]MBC2836006.1 uroporphyrinogen-III synthase [Gemmobacter straminiformis]